MRRIAFIEGPVNRQSLHSQSLHSSLYIGSLYRNCAAGLNFGLLMGSLSTRRDIDGKMAHCRRRTADPAGTGASLCPMVVDVVRQAARRHQNRNGEVEGFYTTNLHDHRQRCPYAGGESVFSEIEHEARDPQGPFGPLPPVMCSFFTDDP